MAEVGSSRKYTYSGAGLLLMMVTLAQFYLAKSVQTK